MKQDPETTKAYKLHSSIKEDGRQRMFLGVLEDYDDFKVVKQFIDEMENAKFLLLASCIGKENILRISDAYRTIRFGIGKDIDLKYLKSYFEKEGLAYQDESKDILRLNSDFSIGFRIKLFQKLVPLYDKVLKLVRTY